MLGALSIMAKTPCLIGSLSADGEPDVVFVEPLRFVSAASCYRSGRIAGFGIKIDKKSVHHGKGLADA